MKFGRKPAVHTRRTMRASLAIFAALDPLGPAPAVSSDYVASVLQQHPGGFGMFLNDQLGDCVCADSCHALMLRTANAGSIVVPSDQDCLALYEAVGGYVPGQPSTDHGCDETAMCQYLIETGLCGQKSTGTGMVDPTNMEHLRWAVQIFGTCRLGINVTDAMMSDFSSGQPWDTFSGNVEGGHDVPIVKYDTRYAYVVTWGAIQPVSWALLADSRFLDEAHAEVWPDFIKAGGTSPSGFSLQDLTDKLAQIEVAP